MDTYQYDPSVYYEDEADPASSATALIHFEFGASVSASAPQRSGEAAASSAASNNNSSAQTSAHLPLHEGSNGGTGLGWTIPVVMVRMERYARFIGRRRFSMSHPAFVFFRCSC
jgi:hypothetical protein